MGSDSRTPLGELLLAYRKQLGLSQEELSSRTNQLSRDGASVGSVSVRTIISLERPVPDQSKQRRPRRDTAHSLAVALGLAPGSPDYTAFMAAARQEPADRPGHAPDPEPPPPRFIETGREPHLRRLAAAVDEAAGGTPTALLVRGETGSGKTSIIQHAARLALERHPSAAVLWAACTESSPRAPGVTPHEPFLRLLRLMLGDLTAANSRQLISRANQKRLAGREAVTADALAHDGPLLAALALSGDALWRRLEARVDDGAVIRRLRALARSGPSDELRVVSGCEQFYRVLRRYAGHGPVIMVMEDLQWGDPATLASLSHLLGRMHRQQHLPIALICSCQPEAVATTDTSELPQVLEEIQRFYHHAAVDLADTMTGAAARGFVEALVAGSATASGAEAVEAMLARTDGNPLDLTELVRLLDSTPGLDAVEALELVRTAVPPALAAGFNARIQSLPNELRDLLTTASVLGAVFLAETLMQMLGLSTVRFIELVDRQLGRQHRLTRPDGTMAIGSFTSHRYRFHPPMLRDYLYGELSDFERSHMHEAAADALIALHSAEGHSALARIAHHFDRAGNRVEAARFHLKAGDRARAARELDDAAAHFRRVAELDVRRDDPVTWIMSLISLGIVARARSDMAAARTHLSHALDLATSHRLRNVRATALEALGMLDYDAGELEASFAKVREAIAIWDADGNPNASRAMANLSYVLYGQGRYDEAMAIAAQGRTAATRAGRERSWIDATIALANIWVDLGVWSEAIELYERCLHLCRDLGDFHRARLCWVNLALVAIEQGDWGAAEAAIDHITTDDEQPIGDSLLAAVALYSGEIAEGRHNLVAAESHFRRSLEIRQREGRDATLIDALAGLLRVATETPDLDSAAELLDELSRRLAERGLDGVERIGKLFVTLVLATDALGRPERARHWLAKGVLVLNARAANIANLTRRESYLNTPPANRWLLQEAARRSVIVG